MNNIEEKFYKTFGIEPIAKKYECKCGTSTTLHNLETCKSKFCDKKYCDQRQTGIYYPEITAKRLLKLLCIVINEYNRDGHAFYFDSTSVKELKEEILDALMGCIDASCDLFEIEVKQIQQLFKEEE